MRQKWGLSDYSTVVYKWLKLEYFDLEKSQRFQFGSTSELIAGIIPVTPSMVNRDIKIHGK